MMTNWNLLLRSGNRAVGGCLVKARVVHLSGCILCAFSGSQLQKWNERGEKVLISNTYYYGNNHRNVLSTLTPQIPLNKRQLKSLNFVIISCLMKLFKTKSMDIINDCITHFELPDIKTIIDTRRNNFIKKYLANNSLIYQTIARNCLN